MSVEPIVSDSLLKQILDTQNTILSKLNETNKSNEIGDNNLISYADVGLIDKAIMDNLATGKDGLLTPKMSDILLSYAYYKSAKDNITINNVLPERIDTDRQTQIIEMQSKLMKVSFEEAKDSMEKQLSAGRMGTVEEFASIVCFLCSEQASYISGQNISVDGGNSSSLF